MEEFSNFVRHFVRKLSVWQLIDTAHFVCSVFGCLCVLLRKVSIDHFVLFIQTSVFQSGCLLSLS